MLLGVTTLATQNWIKLNAFVKYANYSRLSWPTVAEWKKTRELITAAWNRQKCATRRKWTETNRDEFVAHVIFTNVWNGCFFIIALLIALFTHNFYVMLRVFWCAQRTTLWWDDEVKTTASTSAHLRVFFCSFHRMPNEIFVLWI